MKSSCWTAAIDWEAMTLMQHGEFLSHKYLLHKFPVCDSSKVDDWSAATLPVFGPTQVEPKRGSKAFRALFNLCRLQRTALCYGSFDGAFAVSVPESVSFVQGFPIRGVGEHVNNGMAIPYSPHKGAVGAPGVLALSYAAHLEIFAVFMKPDALHDALSGLIGAPLGKKLELDESNYDWRPEPRMVRSLVSLMIAELDREEGDLSPLVLAELEQAILVAFLSGTGHNYTRLLDGRPRDLAPSQVRIVEEYIEAHWNQPISIEGLAVAANASARSVFHAFKEFRGYSPMNFLKQERLRRAREMLTKSGANESVTTVTFACGFGNMGRFADDYQKAFGEMPSETLNRAKGVARDHDTAPLHRSVADRAK
jgi:AraC-like DNA-binding protein